MNHELLDILEDNKKVNFDIPWSGLCHLDKNRVTEYKSLWGDSKYNTIISNIIETRFIIYIPGIVHTVYRTNPCSSSQQFHHSPSNPNFGEKVDSKQFKIIRRQKMMQNFFSPICNHPSQ